MAASNNYRNDKQARRSFDTSRVQLGETLDPELFSKTAQFMAQELNDPNVNKSAQIRRFYDELVMWHDKVWQDKNGREDRFHECEPYIQMLCAKVAYARGRRLVNDGFEQLFSHLIQQIKNPQTLKQAKLFVEAFIGFKKAFEA